MKNYGVGLFYNSKKGYIFAADTTIGKLPMRTAVDPVTILPSTATFDELTQALSDSLTVSENAQPISREKAREYKYWQKLGMKTFSAFSKNFSHVRVLFLGDCYQVSKWIREDRGSYAPSSAPGDEQVLDTSASAQQIMQQVLELLD